MMNTSVDTDELLPSIIEQKVRHFIPVIFCICLLIVIGVIGNIMVFYYYAFKQKVKHTSVFILTLTVYDLAVCLLCMPSTGIAFLVRYYTFENVGACKFTYFITGLTVVGSLLTLIAIAVDRYRCICSMKINSITIKTAKRYCVVIACLSVLVSVFSIFMYEPVKVMVPNDFGVDLYGYDCLKSREDPASYLVWIVTIALPLIFIAGTTAVIICYSKVCIALYRHKKKFGNFKDELQANETDKDVTETSDKTNDKRNNTDQTETMGTEGNNTYKHNDCNQVTSKNKKNEERHKEDINSEQDTCSPQRQDTENIRIPVEDIQQQNNKLNEDIHTKKVPAANNSLKNILKRIDRSTMKLSITLFIITIVFCISLIPYLCLSVWRYAKEEHEGMRLSDPELVLFQFGIRSYYLNSILNPWVYGVCNSSFRQFYYKLICRK